MAALILCLDSVVSIVRCQLTWQWLSAVYCVLAQQYVIAYIVMSDSYTTESQTERARRAEWELNTAAVCQYH